MSNLKKLDSVFYKKLGKFFILREENVVIL